jgi:hypothetical protein
MLAWNLEHDFHKNVDVRVKIGEFLQLTSSTIRPVLRFFPNGSETLPQLAPRPERRQSSAPEDLT